MNSFEIDEKHFTDLNLEWKEWCRQNKHACTTVPFISKSRTGTKHMNSDDWIKWLKFQSGSATLGRILPAYALLFFQQVSSLARKIDVSREDGINAEYIAELRKDELETRATLIRVMPESQHLIMLHFLQHVIDCVEACGSIRGTWYFRSETLDVLLNKSKAGKTLKKNLYRPFNEVLVPEEG